MGRGAGAWARGSQMSEETHRADIEVTVSMAPRHKAEADVGAPSSAAAAVIEAHVVSTGRRSTPRRSRYCASGWSGIPRSSHILEKALRKERSRGLKT